MKLLTIGIVLIIGCSIIGCSIIRCSCLNLKEGLYDGSKCYKPDGSIVPYTRPDDKTNKCGGLQEGKNVKWVDQSGCCHMIRLDEPASVAKDPKGYFKAESTGKINNPLNSALSSTSDADMEDGLPWNEIWVPPPPQKPDTQIADILNTQVKLKQEPAISPYYNKNLYFKTAQANAEVANLEKQLKYTEREFDELQSLRSASQRLLNQQTQQHQDKIAQTMQDYIGQVMTTAGENLYILKSQIVPPICPACPTQVGCADTTGRCPACPPCERCPDPTDCETVVDYQISGLGKPRSYHF